MKITRYRNNNKDFLKDLSDRNNLFENSKIPIVRQIIADVQKNGDVAIIESCNKFDGANFCNSQDFLVSQQEISEAKNNIKPQLLQALKLAYERIFSYHQKQLPQDLYHHHQNVELGNVWKAIDSVGVYVPGGTANYPSSVLMGAVPAIVAGVKNICITVPSNKG